MSSPQSQGPNMLRLAAHKMALDAIPAGGGLADGTRFLTTEGAIGKSAKAAAEWVRDAIAAIRAATDPNPWRDADDEAIAAEILRQIHARKRTTP